MTQRVTLRPAHDHEARTLHDLLTHDDEWTRWNGPYIPYEHPTFEAYESRMFQRLRAGQLARVIDVDGDPVGVVTFYWQDERTRWLEAGVVIYDPARWGQGIATRALTQWVTHLFETQVIERVGMTTWSGHARMMACAERLGFTLEGRLRKVRYHEGVYYDSIKYGVLRQEWAERVSAAP